MTECILSQKTNGRFWSVMWAPVLEELGFPQELGVIYPSVLALSFPSSSSWRLASQQRREGVAFLAVVLLYYKIYTLKMRNREGLGMKNIRLQHSSKKEWARPTEGALDPKLLTEASCVSQE